MVTGAIDALGRLDFLVNNAGTPATPTPIPFSDLDALTEEFWSRILTTNLIGPFRCAHAAVPALKAARGAICNTASIAGVMGSGSSIPYATSKAGLINLTRSLARTLAPEIRVNAVAPGYIETSINETGRQDQSHYQRIADRTAFKRWGQPDDVAGAVVFLCMPASRYATGTVVAIDGGFLAG